MIVHYVSKDGISCYLNTKHIENFEIHDNTIVAYGVSHYIHEIPVSSKTAALKYIAKFLKEETIIPLSCIK